MTVDKHWLDAYEIMAGWEYSHEDIARELGISVAALQKRLNRARREGDPRAVHGKYSNRK